MAKTTGVGWDRTAQNRAVSVQISSLRTIARDRSIAYRTKRSNLRFVLPEPMKTYWRDPRHTDGRNPRRTRHRNPRHAESNLLSRGSTSSCTLDPYDINRRLLGCAYTHGLRATCAPVILKGGEKLLRCQSENNLRDRPVIPCGTV